jgi:hypothetical protein
MHTDMDTNICDYTENKGRFPDEGEAPFSVSLPENAQFAGKYNKDRRAARKLPH